MNDGGRVGVVRGGGCAPILIHDCLLAYFSVLLAFLLVAEPTAVPSGLGTMVVFVAPTFTLLAAGLFLALGLHRSLWRFTSMADLVAIAKATTLSVLLFLPMLWLWAADSGTPRSLPMVQWLLLLVMLGGPRFASRLWHHRRRDVMRDRDPAAGRRRLLLFGTGEASKHFADAVADDPAQAYRIVGMLDPSGRQVGRRLGSIPVVGRLDEATAVIRQLRRAGSFTSHIVLTESLDRERLRRLVDEAAQLGVTVSRLPDPVDLREAVADGRIELRPVALRDLLGRPQAVLDHATLGRLIRGRRALITGAGGSIGGELGRQIAALGPARLTLLDHGEFNLYQAELELRTENPGLALEAHLCDVRDRVRLEQVIGGTRPHLVFHAAALKHVPIVERDPSEGVLTNAIGTRNVADATRRCGALAMVLVSTDKAVNPTSVMGASKRLAELYVQALDLPGAREATPAAAPATRFLTVRFGNVLGSSGSVVPLFQQQLARGGPLTVTHPEIRRYFMTIEEAVQLTLHASAHGLERADQRGEILVLDMGEPIRIIDVARQMIRLAGLRPDRDVEIRIIGLRSGEKLYEELFDAAEERLGADIAGVFAAVGRPIDERVLRRSLDELELVCCRHEPREIVRIIRLLIPGFQATAQPTGDPVVPLLFPSAAAPAAAQGA